VEWRSDRYDRRARVSDRAIERREELRGRVFPAIFIFASITIGQHLSYMENRTC
jgi:hypothetical protein